MKTLTAAGLAIVASLVVGTALAVLRVQLKSLQPATGSPAGGAAGGPARTGLGAVNAITRLCVEVFRGLPVVITIFFVWLGAARDRHRLRQRLWYLVIGLTIYNWW